MQFLLIDVGATLAAFLVYLSFVALARRRAEGGTPAPHQL